MFQPYDGFHSTTAFLHAFLVAISTIKPTDLREGACMFKLYNIDVVYKMAVNSRQIQSNST